MTEALKRVNEEWNRAWLEKDVAAVEAVAADDYVYIGPQGQVLDRTAILEIVRSPTYKLIKAEWSEVQVEPLGADSALVRDRFTGRGEYCGTGFDEDHRRTTVWVRRQDGWQVRLEHCSAIKPID